MAPQPPSPKHALRSVGETLRDLPLAMIVTFQDAARDALDDDILMCACKIDAWCTFFEHVRSATVPNVPDEARAWIAQTYMCFIQQSMNASDKRAIVCLSMQDKLKLTGQCLPGACSTSSRRTNSLIRHRSHRGRA